MVALTKLIASNRDSLDYITYVFKNLEDNIPSRLKYIMCVRYPNWNSKNLKLGDKGYLHYEEVRAGIDKWYNGKEMVPYKYDAVQFIKFIPLQTEKEHEYIM